MPVVLTPSPVRRAALVLAGALAAAVAVPARAQVTPPLPDTLRPPPQAAPPAAPADTVRPLARDTARPARVVRDTAAADTLGGLSPKGAFLRSLVLPGWGQSELGSTNRGSIYFALEAASLWMLYTSNRKLDEAEQREAYLKVTGQIPEDRTTGLVRSRRAQREDWITLSIFWLFFSGADAFVDAHLRDFNAHVGALPTPNGGVQVQATVPTGR